MAGRRPRSGAGLRVPRRRFKGFLVNPFRLAILVREWYRLGYDDGMTAVYNYSEQRSTEVPDSKWLFDSICAWIGTEFDRDYSVSKARNEKIKADIALLEKETERETKFVFAVIDSDGQYPTFREIQERDSQDAERN